MTTPQNDEKAAGEALAESVDLFRERLIEADVADDVVSAWRDAAIALWDAVAAMEGE